MNRFSKLPRFGICNLAVVLIVLTCLLSAVPAANACPNCKEAMVNDASQQGDLVHGYFYSILFMMSMPFALVGTFSFCMYRAVRKARTVEESRRHLATDRDVDADTEIPSGLPPRDSAAF